MELFGRFVEGSELRATNLRQACVDQTWAEQQQQFAGFLLTQLCAVVEAFLDDLLLEAGVNARRTREELATDLQFPAGGAGARQRNVATALASLTASPSQLMTQAFHATLAAAPRWRPNHLDGYVAAYRYFKEARNDLLHRGGRSSQRSADAHATFLSAFANGSLGLGEVPRTTAPVPGQPHAVELRGVVGLSDVILHIARILDTHLAGTQAAERLLFARWTSTYMAQVQLPKPGPRRDQAVRRKLRAAGLPVPASITGVEAELRRRHPVF